jgi:hypothetical protein
MPITQPPLALAPLAEASMTPLRPPLTSVKPFSAIRRPISSAMRRWRGAGALAPISPILLLKDGAPAGWVFNPEGSVRRLFGPCRNGCRRCIRAGIGFCHRPRL